MSEPLTLIITEQGDDEGDLGWQEQALCAQTDPEAFFPEKGGSTREAKRICVGCEVKAECLEYALANDERFGIWGGLSERERRRIKRDAVICSPGARDHPLRGVRGPDRVDGVAIAALTDLEVAERGFCRQRSDRSLFTSRSAVR